MSAKRPETALHPAEYAAVFGGADKTQFSALPAWRQLELRKAAQFY